MFVDDTSEYSSLCSLFSFHTSFFFHVGVNFCTRLSVVFGWILKVVTVMFERRVVNTLGLVLLAGQKVP